MGDRTEQKVRSLRAGGCEWPCLLRRLAVARTSIASFGAAPYRFRLNARPLDTTTSSRRREAASEHVTSQVVGASLAAARLPIFSVTVLTDSGRACA